MTELPPHDADLFDEAGYLRLYPGIAEAMMQGVIDTAWSHFRHHGRGEGRRPNDVDPEFYLAAYPEITRDLGREATPADAAPHYLALGRARGYRPNAGAPRPPNPAAPPSPFGGLWTDQANAADLIEARRELGWIRRRDAGMLRDFAQDGIAELQEVLDRDRIAEAVVAVDQIFTGLHPELLFAAEHRAIEPQPWRPELTEQPVAALDPHMVSRKIRDLLLDPALTRFLTLLFAAPPRLVASRAALREASAAERDVARYAFTLPLQFVAVTFSLREAQDGSTLVWPGSHRLPDLPWPGGDISLPEARRRGPVGLADALAHRGQRVRALLRGREPRRLALGLGTRMVRHGNLIHAVEPPSPPLRPCMLTAWYCPSFVLPGYLETTPARAHHQDGIEFRSGVYPTLDPRD